MPQTPKEKGEPDKESNWEDDQRERGYYYDDAHGYEEFDPEKDDLDDEEAD